MLTPSIRAYNYSIKSHDAYAHWYASQIGVTNGDIIAAGQKRSLHLIEEAIDALLIPLVVEEVSDALPEEVYEATSEVTPEEIGNSVDFPSDLTYDAMTVKELKAQCTSRGLIALRLKRDDEGISESMTDTEAPEESAAENESDAPADEAAVTKGETNDHSDNKQKSIDAKE